MVYTSSVMEGHGISYLHLLSVGDPVHPAGGSGDVLPCLLCFSTPNSLTIPFIASVWNRAWLNCAVKSRLKSNPVQKRPSGCSCWA
ncbi:hypothetical protein ACNKHM_09460 [Shigella sonnei]